METLAKADIFFLITAGAVVLVTLFLLAILFYILKILRDVEDITENVKNESKNIVDDVSYVRRTFEKGSKRIKNIIRPSSHKKTKKQ